MFTYVLIIKRFSCHTFVFTLQYIQDQYQYRKILQDEYCGFVKVRIKIHSVLETVIKWEESLFRLYVNINQFVKEWQNLIFRIQIHGQDDSTDSLVSVFQAVTPGWQLAVCAMCTYIQRSHDERETQNPVKVLPSRGKDAETSYTWQI